MNTDLFICTMEVRRDAHGARNTEDESNRAIEDVVINGNIVSIKG